MKNCIILILLITFLSCDSVKKEKKEVQQTIPSKEKVDPMPESTIEEVNNTLIQLKKEPCSGDCPVFEVTISKDKTLTYNGIEYTNISGIHTVELSENQYDKLISILNESGFSELDSTYTESGTKDFSNTILSYQGKDIKVRLWKDAPKELTNVYVFIEDILYENKYLE